MGRGGGRQLLTSLLYGPYSKFRLFVGTTILPVAVSLCKVQMKTMCWKVRVNFVSLLCKYHCHEPGICFVVLFIEFLPAAEY